MTKPPTLNIESKLAAGAPGEDADPWNPLARATRALLDDGARFRAAAQVYLADSATGGIARWIGIVVEGMSGRLVFFPGLSERPDTMRYQRTHDGAQGGIVVQAFNVDHLTLERDWCTWHATQLRGVGPSRQGGPRVWDLGEGNVLWFGMSIGKDAALREVKQTTIATALAPSNAKEARDRLDEFGRAVKSAEMAVIAKPGLPPFRRALCHFSFIVGSPSAPVYTGTERGFGGTLDGALKAFEPPKGMRRQSLFTTANISERVRLQVIATWFPGEIAGPAVFYGRAT